MRLESHDAQPEVERQEAQAQQGVRAGLARDRRLLRLTQAAVVESVSHKQCRQGEQRQREKDVEVEEQVGEVVRRRRGAIQVGSVPGEHVVQDDVQRWEGPSAVRPRVDQVDGDLSCQRLTLLGDGGDSPRCWRQ